MVIGTPPTLITIGILPFALTNDVVQVNVIVGDVPLSAEHANVKPVIPVAVEAVFAATPFTETIVTDCAAVHLYAKTCVVALEATALETLPAKTCDSFVKSTVYASAPLSPVSPLSPLNNAQRLIQ